MTAGLGEVVAVRREVARVTAALDPALFETAGAVAVLEHVVAMRNMLAAVEAEFASRLAETEQWRRAGFRSAEEWLASKSGTSRPRAAGNIATGKRMRRQRKVAQAAKAGALSPEQTRLVAEAAAADPAAEERLLKTAARSSFNELRDECQRVKAAADPDPDATHARIRAARFLRRWRDAEGAGNLAGRGVPEDTALLGAVLDELADELLTRDRLAGSPLASPEAYSWDALIELVRRWKRGVFDADGAANDGAANDDATEDAADSIGNDDDTADAGVEPLREELSTATPPARTRRPRSRSWLALLRLDVSALQRGMVEGEELCEIAGVGPIPVRVARQLLGDAVLKLVITRGVDVVNLTHLGRGPTVAQRCALLFTDPRCHVQGCDRQWDEVDHDVDWAQTRHTTLSELVGFCGHHHDLKTYGGWVLVPGTGRRPMVPPDDPRHPRNTGPPGPAPDPAPPGASDTLF